MTAERRSTDLQKVALSVTAISAQDLERHADTDVNQALQSVASVVVQGITAGPSQQSVQGGGGPPDISIRGLGTNAVNTSGAVAVYEDGVLLQGGGANFYDMSRVEVLRGPQGTLYGRGATAGAVNFITNDPTQNFEAAGRIQYGSYNLLSTQGMVNVPLSDAWSLRAAFNQIRHDGYFNNGMSNEDDLSTRVKLRFKPSDDLSVILGFVDYKSSGTGPGQVPISATAPSPKDWVSDLAGGGTDPISYRKAYLDFELNLGFADLTYIGGYQTTTSVWSTQGTFSYLVIPQNLNRTFTNELRLAHTNDSGISWLAGAYEYQNKLHFQYEPGPAPTAGGTYSPFFDYAQNFAPRSVGLFGELTYALTSTTRLTGGVRETFDHINVGIAQGVGATFDYAETNIKRFDWKARVETDLSQNNLLYATVSTGYRPGTYTTTNPPTLNKNESLTAYEVGSKNAFGTAFTLNGAVFYYDYSGFTEGTQFQNPANPAFGGIGIALTIPAKFYGAELEAALKLSPYDTLKLSPSLLHAKFTANLASLIDPFTGTPTGTTFTDGGKIPNAPSFMVSGSYEHVFPLPNGAQLSWDADASYKSEYLTDYDTSNYPTTNPIFSQKAYTIANSSLTYTAESGKYSFSAYGKNLGNTIYKATVYNPNPPYVFVGDPRTYGVAFSVKL